MLHLFRSNPGLIVSVALMIGCALVCALVALFMHRAGASLRPVAWFAGFFGLIVLPQFLGHLWMAVRATNQNAPRVEALENITAAAQPQARTGDAQALFGPDVDPQLVVDMRHLFEGMGHPAESAQFAALPNGDSVLIARFTSSAETEKAWVGYLRESGLAQLDGKGDSHRGYAATRPVGDRAYALPMSTLLGVWTGADDTAIRHRMAAGGFDVPRGAPLGGVDAASPVGARLTKPAPFPLTLALPALALYVLVISLYFFKGAAWAGTTRAHPGTAAVSAFDLAARLEAVNALDVPFTVERGAHPQELIATWRYADAKWVDLARARGMRHTFRIRLTLDEASGQVRATDYAGRFDWSVGRGGAAVEWKAMLGIVFFHYEHQRVFGLQIDDQGHPKPELSYAYTFNLAEMKSPLIELVTRSGWTWRPTVWQGPTWLRWMTE